MGTSRAYLQLRRGTAAEWASSEPQPDGEVLRLGEPGYEKDTGKLKIGDGTTGWNNLDYFANGSSMSTEDIQDIVGGSFLVGISGISVDYDDNANSLTIAYTGDVGLINIIEDATPQLGGDLDINTNDIVGAGNISISGDITAISGTLDVLSFNLNNESTLTRGQISWDDTEGTMDIGLTDNTTIHIGSHRYFRVRNETGGTLYKGQVVYATGVHANGIIEPALYVADGTIREVRFMGVVLEDVNHQNNGYVIDFGHLENMDLDGSATNYAVGDETWSNGDILYVHPTVAGKLTNVEPKHSISVAIILDIGNGNGSGRMFVRPISYGHMDDNHDVSLSSVSNHDVLVYNSGTSYWENKPGIISDPSGITGASSIFNIVQMSQTDYDNLSSTDPNTLYVIR